MLRPSILLSLLAAFGALIPIACVQDFGVFEPTGSGGSGTNAGGAGGSVISAAGGNGGSVAVTSSVAASSGGMSGETACNDGEDNDGDGSADCADIDCTGVAKYACVDRPDGGWQGPIALFEGTSATVPSCPSAFPMQVFAAHEGPTAPDYACNDCSCDPIAVTCAPANAEFFVDAACGGAPVATVGQSATCAQIKATVQKAKIAAPTAMAAAGACAPRGGGVSGQLPAPTWTTNSVGCAAADQGEGCGGTNSFCTPPLSADFNHLCVYKPGSFGMCPGDFPQRHTYFDKFADSRGCSACGCGNPNPATCTAQTNAFGSGDCGGAATILPDNGMCVDAAAVSNGSIKVTATPNSVTCAKQGGAKIGSLAVDVASALTVCCKN